MMRTATVVAVALPFLGIVAAAILTWGWGVSWVELSLLAIMYSLTAIGVTVGYHRLFSHRSFETTKSIRFILAALGSTAVQGSVLKWVAMHRRHHQFSDTPEDPHSPCHHGDGLKGLVKGFFHAHLGWLFEKHPPGLEKYVPDLRRMKSVRLASAMFPLWITLGLLLPAVVGGLVTLSWYGALTGFIWGGLVRVFLVHHVTWSVNSICHLFGSRPYPEKDQSRNNLLFGILAFGEGWHNNHHAFPTSARHGLKWWQFDISYIFIRSLEICGLAWKVKVPKVSDSPTPEVLV